MASVEKLGKSDVFLTFTCNPKWPEITENLLPGQTTDDRHLGLHVKSVHDEIKSFERRFT